MDNLDEDILELERALEQSLYEGRRVLITKNSVLYATGIIMESRVHDGDYDFYWIICIRLDSSNGHEAAFILSERGEGWARYSRFTGRGLYQIEALD